MRPISQKVEVSLEDAYHGKMTKVEYDRKVICGSCNGKGGEDVLKCTKCEGAGAVVKMVQVAPGMYSQHRQTCQDCKGKGETFSEDKLCKECKGEKIVAKHETQEVEVPIGVADQYPVTLKSKGNEYPDVETGDFVAVIFVTEHPVFKRVKNDLLITKKISLLEALTGFSFNLEHFNGEVTITVERNHILNNKDLNVVRNLGMPHLKSPMSHGDLLIEYEVEMPKEVSDDAIELLKKALPAPLLPPPKPTKNTYISEDHTHVKGQNFKPHHGQGEEEEEDEHREFPHGAKAVNCQTQ